MSGFSKRGGDEQLDPHAEFHSHMKRAGLPYSVVSTFNSESYLMGASIEVSDSVSASFDPFYRLAAKGRKPREEESFPDPSRFLHRCRTSSKSSRWRPSRLYTRSALFLVVSSDPSSSIPLARA
jgi:hypothetical protein